MLHTAAQKRYQKLKKEFTRLMECFNRDDLDNFIQTGHSDDVDQSFRFDADQIGAKRRRPLPV
jgi:hypothetical protein